MADLAARVVVVTGAAGNLGTAVARVLEAAGAAMVLVDSKAGRLRAGPSPKRLLVEGIDLAREADAARAVEAAVRRFGRLDGLVNAAGGFAGGRAVHEEDPDAWRAMMDINLRTALFASRAAVPAMLAAGGGSIVNVAARAAFAAPAGLAPYAASKAAVLKLTEAMAAELKGRGIRVNALVPATIDTPQNRQAMPKADHAKWTPPEAIAEVAAFLLGDAARAVTGAAIPV
jgi:NAD(P)-dependent dehydrogenase (short-subunit alcohol dehydrogenase family)